MEKVAYIVACLFAIGLISFSVYASKCHGDSCATNVAQVTKDEKLDTKSAYTTYSEMDPQILTKQVAGQEVFLLDVREESEWDEGHIAGATLLPLGSITAESVANLPKDVPLYIYCRSGRRASEAEATLRTLGFHNAKNIGGINDWLERGGKLVK